MAEIFDISPHATLGCCNAVCKPRVLFLCQALLLLLAASGQTWFRVYAQKSPMEPPQGKPKCDTVMQLRHLFRFFHLVNVRVPAAAGDKGCCAETAKGAWRLSNACYQRTTFPENDFQIYKNTGQPDTLSGPVRVPLSCQLLLFKCCSSHLADTVCSTFALVRCTTQKTKRTYYRC